MIGRIEDMLYPIVYQVECKNNEGESVYFLHEWNLLKDFIADSGEEMVMLERRHDSYSEVKFTFRRRISETIEEVIDDYPFFEFLRERE